MSPSTGRSQPSAARARRRCARRRARAGTRVRACCLTSRAGTCRGRGATRTPAAAGYVIWVRRRANQKAGDEDARAAGRIKRSLKEATRTRGRGAHPIWQAEVARLVCGGAYWRAALVGAGCERLCASASISSFSSCLHPAFSALPRPVLLVSSPVLAAAHVHHGHAGHRILSARTTPARSALVFKPLYFASHSSRRPLASTSTPSLPSTRRDFPRQTV